MNVFQVFLPVSKQLLNENIYDFKTMKSESSEQGGETTQIFFACQINCASCRAKVINLIFYEYLTKRDCIR